MRIYGRDKKMKAETTKGEHMTSLSGGRLVSKTHGRIAFRGVIDTLQAEVIEAQVLASELGKKADSTGGGESLVCGCLGEILEYLRNIIAAEVKETPLPPPFLFGMDAEEIHRRSHNAGGKTFLLPAYTQGTLAARINTLRAKLREAELLAVRVFGPGEDPQREDIILALNRLSSALWWLFCEYVSGNPASTTTVTPE